MMVGSTTRTECTRSHWYPKAVAMFQVPPDLQTGHHFHRDPQQARIRAGSRVHVEIPGEDAGMLDMS